jgi:hypothetical protein
MGWAPTVVPSPSMSLHARLNKESSTCHFSMSEGIFHYEQQRLENDFVALEPF